MRTLSKQCGMEKYCIFLKSNHVSNKIMLWSSIFLKVLQDKIGKRWEDVAEIEFTELWRLAKSSLNGNRYSVRILEIYRNCNGSTTRTVNPLTPAFTSLHNPDTTSA